jgi:hypothetical protein
MVLSWIARPPSSDQYQSLEAKLNKLSTVKNQASIIRLVLDDTPFIQLLSTAEDDTLNLAIPGNYPKKKTSTTTGQRLQA